MLPAELYNQVYTQALLAVTLFACVIYLRGESGEIASAQFNANFRLIFVATCVLFIGMRPLSAEFVDMFTYNRIWEAYQFSGQEVILDWSFSLVVAATSFFETSQFFFLVCAAIYLTPLLLLKRVHGEWSTAVIVAIAGSFVFFAYGVNTIRQGMAASLLIGAICFADKRLVAITLAAAAVGMHKSMAAPALIFAAASLVRSTWTVGASWIIWLICLGLSLSFGNQISLSLSRFISLGDEDRIANYIEGVGRMDRGGFRWDFILYSIIPVLGTYLLSIRQSITSLHYRRILVTYLLSNAFWLLNIHAGNSDRFAYVSWFLLPWVITAPFLPDNSSINTSRATMRPRYGVLTLVLLAHYSFTYYMKVFFYGNVIY